MTFTEYAKHRGVCQQAVSKAVAAGRITVEFDRTGRRWIDPTKADREWDANTDEAKQEGAKVILRRRAAAAGDGDPSQIGASEAPPDDSDDGADDDGEPEDESGTPTYAESRARREHYNALLAELTYQQKAGALVDADDVRRGAGELAKVVREAILAIPDRIAAELASETDPHRVHVKLADELRRALEEIADGGG